VGYDDTVDELVIVVDTTAPVVTVNFLTTNAMTPTLTGEVDDPAAIVEVAVDGITYSATNNGDGTWSVDITNELPEGTYDVQVTATDAVDNVGYDDTVDELVIVVDTTAPVVTVDFLTTNAMTPTLTGTVDDPAAIVEVTVDGIVYSATNNGDGTWSVDITNELLEGTYDVQVSATDAAGNVGNDDTVDELVIDTTLPIVTVDFLTTNAMTPTLTGTVDDPAATVEVTVDGNFYDATINDDGTWSVDITVELPDGTYDVQVTATDAAGNVDNDDTIDELVIAYEVQLSISGAVKDANGTAVAGVIITASGGYTATTASNGTYRLTDLSSGTYTITPTLKGYTFEPVNRSVQVASADSTGQDFTASKTYTISGAVKDANGTAVAGVTITTSGGYTATTASNGTYRLTDLPAGTYTITPTLKGYTFEPVNRSVQVASADSTGQDFTASKTYMISGVVKDKNGKAVASVSIMASGGYTTTTASDGTYRLTNLPAGTYTITPTLKGYTFEPVNRSVQVTSVDSTGQDFTANKDTTAPKVTVNTLTTNKSTPMLTGTIDDPTATVTIIIQRAITTTMVYSKTYTATNDGKGAWSVVVTEKLVDGSYDVVAVATDLVGNSATETGKGVLVIDTISPKVSVKTLRTSETTPQLTGTIDDPTAVVTVTVQSAIYTATNRGDGNWDITLTDALSVGTYDVVAIATDTAGNGGQDTTTNELEITSTQQPVSKLKLDVASGYNDLQLQWNALSDIRVTQYVVLFGKGSDPTLSAKTSLEKTTTYYDTEGLTRGESYCYQIVAQQTNGTPVETSNRACGTYGNVALRIPNTYARPGQQAVVPVNIRNANRLKIAAGNIYLDYDSTVLEFVGVSKTALTEGYAWTHADHTIDSTTNRVIISAIASPPPELYGKGSLFWLTFQVLGKDGDTSLLNLREFIGGGTGGSQLYTPDDLENPVPLELEDGILTVGSKYMLGDVSGNGAVGAEDAYLALQIASGKKEPTPEQLSAGDANGNGKVDAGDVAMILYYASHQTWPTPSQTSLLSAASMSAIPAATAVNMKIGDVQVKQDQTAQAAVLATGLADWAGGDFTIAYDPTVIEAGSFTATKTDMTSGFTLEYYDDGQGGLRISLANGTPLSGDGALVALTFKVKATSGTSDLVFATAGLYDVYGRDFEQSALQQTVEREDGTVSLDGQSTTGQQKIYMPYIVR
jgi:hypothetical protein